MFIFEKYFELYSKVSYVNCFHKLNDFSMTSDLASPDIQNKYKHW